MQYINTMVVVKIHCIEENQSLQSTNITSIRSLWVNEHVIALSSNSYNPYSN